MPPVFWWRDSARAPHPFPILKGKTTLRSVPPPLTKRVTRPKRAIGNRPPGATIHYALSNPLPTMLGGEQQQKVCAAETSTQKQNPQSGISQDYCLSDSYFFKTFTDSNNYFSFRSSDESVVYSFVLTKIASLPGCFSDSTMRVVAPQSSFFYSSGVPSVASPLDLPSLSDSQDHLT